MSGLSEGGISLNLYLNLFRSGAIKFAFDNLVSNRQFPFLQKPGSSYQRTRIKTKETNEEMKETKETRQEMREETRRGDEGGDEGRDEGGDEGEDEELSKRQW